MGASREGCDMRKLPGLILVLVLLLSSPASATWRADPDDSANVLDINLVTTGRADRAIYFRVSSYASYVREGRLNRTEDSYWSFTLDTRGDRTPDRLLYLYWSPPDDSLYREITSRSGNTIGTRRDVRRTDNAFSCRIPRRWLGITKPVRFFVESWSTGTVVDRAPDQARYRGF
jgi:hypothetical protein